MITEGDAPQDLSSLVVPQRGSLEATSDPFEPYRLVDGDGVIVVPVAVYLRELQASGRSAATQRSYAYDLLRWWRFLDAAGVVWDQATRAEARISAAGSRSPASRCGRTGASPARGAHGRGRHRRGQGCRIR